MKMKKGRAFLKNMECVYTRWDDREARQVRCPTSQEKDS